MGEKVRPAGRGEEREERRVVYAAQQQAQQLREVQRDFGSPDPVRAPGAGRVQGAVIGAMLRGREPYALHEQ